MLNIRSVIMWSIMWLLLFMLSIPSINLIKFLALGWPIYNSKSSKLNGSASLSRKRVLVTLKVFIKASYLAQWLNLPLAILFLKILLLAAKTSLLALPAPRAITTPPYHMPLFPLLLCQLSLLCLLWPNSWKMTFSKFLGPFWILELLFLLQLLHQLFTNTKTLVRGLWRPGS